MRNDRREFLKMALAGAVSLIGGEVRGAETRDGQSASGKSTVIQIQSRRALRGSRPDADAVHEMLDRAMTALCSRHSPAEAWRSIVSPADRVGIKVNCIGRQNLSTHPDVVLAIVEGLKSAGVDPRNIVVFDREESELSDAGFRPPAVGGVLCRAAVEYSERLLPFGAGATRLPRLLDEITALINVPVLKDHQIAGITIAMKNLSHGLCQNPWDFHSNNCDPYIAQIFALPEIRRKLRLTVCDAVIGACDGGPTGMTRAALWPCGALLVGRDAVAIDRVGMDLIEGRRRERGLMSLARRGTPPRQLVTAGKMGLGNYMAEKIEVVRVEAA